MSLTVAILVIIIFYLMVEWTIPYNEFVVGLDRDQKDEENWSVIWEVNKITLLDNDMISCRNQRRRHFDFK
jgi:hypothetical protein